MTVKQLSVFVENSLADTTESGLLRLIVSDPECGMERLKEAGFSSMVTEVLIIRIPHRAGSLQEILEIIADEGISIEYMYGLSVGVEDACVVMKTGDLSAAMTVLSKNGIGTLGAAEVAAL